MIKNQKRKVRLLTFMKIAAGMTHPALIFAAVMFAAVEWIKQ
jgi:hypothetical protein